MGHFTQDFQKEYEFDGDNITVKMKRLTRPNAAIINPHVSRVSERARKAEQEQGKDFDKSKLLSQEEMVEYMEATEKVLRDSIVRIDGLFIEGNQVVVGSDLYETVLTHVYFTELLVRIVNDLVAASHLTADEEKKSEEPPGDTSTT